MAGLNKGKGLFFEPSGGGGATYDFTFVNGDLIGGVLTVSHSLGTNYPKPLIQRPDCTYEDAVAIMTFITTNSISFDFGGAIAAGTWIGQIGE